MHTSHSNVFVVGGCDPFQGPLPRLASGHDVPPHWTTPPGNGRCFALHNPSAYLKTKIQLRVNEDEPTGIDEGLAKAFEAKSAI